QPSGRNGKLSAICAQIRVGTGQVDYGMSDVDRRADDWQMVESVKERETHLKPTCMAPARSLFRDLWKDRPVVLEGEACRLGRNNGPSLRQKRETTWRHARQPDTFERLASRLDRHPHAHHRQKLGVDDIEVVARRKTIGRTQDVCPTPSDELFPH